MSNAQPSPFEPLIPSTSVNPAIVTTDASSIPQATPTDGELLQLIEQSTHLTPSDKSYLINQISLVAPLDKLRLKHSLANGHAPAILDHLRIIRDKFATLEKPKALNPVAKVINTLFKPAPPKIVSNSFLNQGILLGGQVPKLIATTNIATLPSLSQIDSLDQLKILTSNHISFNLNQNTDYEMQIFYQKISGLFSKIHSINERRNYFLNFLSSPLFKAYINTGLTALRHPELQPASIVLNTMYQIDAKYLNNKQFRLTANISTCLRGLCGL
jgi:hypothetical protein